MRGSISGRKLNNTLFFLETKVEDIADSLDDELGNMLEVLVQNLRATIGIDRNFTGTITNINRTQLSKTLSLLEYKIEDLESRMDGEEPAWMLQILIDNLRLRLGIEKIEDTVDLNNTEESATRTTKVIGISTFEDVMNVYDEIANRIKDKK